MGHILLYMDVVYELFYEIDPFADYFKYVDMWNFPLQQKMLHKRPMKLFFFLFVVQDKTFWVN